MAKKDDKKKVEAVCDYCGRPSSEVANLVESPTAKESRNGRPPEHQVFICNECIHLCQSVLAQQGNTGSGQISVPDDVPTPREIVEHLDKYVVGQDRAKRALAVAVSSHYKRLRDEAKRQQDGDDGKDELGETVIEKSNILLVGPTGSGKTLLAKTLAKILQVPFAIGDATTLTEAGYVGEDVENLVLKLLRNADFDIELAQTGIIYIDEVDKIGRSTTNFSITRDVSGEGVQQSLLKMLEGTVCNVPPTGGRKHPEQQYIPIDTTNILFICGGTFVGLDEIIARRTGKRGIGFGASREGEAEKDKNKLLEQVTEDDLVEFGIIPEFIGRLPVQVPLSGLSEETLAHVLVDPKDSLVRQYKKLCRYDNVNIEFTDEAIREIAKIAHKKNTGARGLRSVVENFMQEILYELPEHNGETILIDEKVVRKEVSPFKKKGGETLEVSFAKPEKAA
jgi:ATP-dependent Clp protease ATP-binding subunit ClpX